MSLKSIIKRTLNLCDHKIVSVEDNQKYILIYLEKKFIHRLPCSCCGARCKPRDKLKIRTWRHVPLWGISVYLNYTPRRINCKNCGIKVEDIPWSRGKSPLTLPFIISLAIFAKLLAWDQVARYFKVCWSTVASAVQSAVEYGLERRDISKIRIIGIDEISRKKGHVYHTNIYDLETKTLIWSGEGRKADTMIRFFDDMGEDFAKNLKGICCDMWDPYVKIIKERASQAILVFDKFHLIKHLLDAVNNVRKEEVKRLSNMEEIDDNPLKRTKYIWLKNPWNLTPKQNQRLGYLQKLNLKISRAYLLKEAFREVWYYDKRGWARRFLKKWFWWATHSRIKPMRDFAWMLRRHEENILSWFNLPIDNGAVEAMNNNAKEISHRARGYRSEKIFSLAMLHCLGGLQMPETTHKFV